MADEPGPQSLFGESEPPETAPQVVGAAAHQAQNPFWSGRGRGGGGGKRRRAGGGDTNPSTNPSTNPPVDPASTQLVLEPEPEPPRFARISLRELELQRLRGGDGVESSVASDDEDLYRAAQQSRRRHKTTVPAAAADKLAFAAFGGSSGGSGGGSGGGGSTGGAPRPKKRKPRGDNLEEDDDDVDGDEDDEEEDECQAEQADQADEESSVVESSVFGGGECGDFPVRGETCIGCLFDRNAVGIIDKFVRENCSKMTETALFKAASSTWINAVVAPRAKENVRCPRWNWKSIQNHYELHVSDPLLQRVGAIRSLGQMRAFQEASLLKVMPDGTKVLDNKSAELLLKTVALLDKQISSLGQLEASSKMPPPPPRGR